MSPAPISRRAVVAGSAAALAAMAVPAGVVEAGAAGTASTGSARSLPAAFDPRAFCNDLIDAGYRLHATKPVPIGWPGEDLRPSYIISAVPGRGFGKDYENIMARWAEAIDACPNHVEQVVAYAFKALVA